MLGRAVARLDAGNAERVRLETPSAGTAIGHWEALGLDRLADNLLSNALKCSPPDEPVEVVPRRHDATVELTMHDTGIGLEKDDIARLFRRYQRTRDAIESAVAGTGLGLYFARTLVESHHGRI